MYDQSGFFSTHEAHPFQGEAASYGGSSGSFLEKLKLPSFPHEVPNSNIRSELELHGQFGFNMKQEFDFPHCHDPTILWAMAPMDLNSSSEVFLGELPADCGSAASTFLYDPAVHLGFPDDPLSREAINPLPHECGFLSSSMGSGGPFGDGLGEGYIMGQVQNLQQKTRKRTGVQRVVEKHEKQRRERLSNMFEVLKSLIPNPTKPDRASIIGDTIDYISELLRTADELKILVTKKRRRRDRNKSVAMGDEVTGDVESSSMMPLIDSENNTLKQSLRSSWLQRRSKDTHVDVRIIEDEVTIKLTQRRKINSLLLLSKVLHELQLELLDLSCGSIGDYHIILSNNKIHEGSCVYASAIAKKLIEVVDL